MNKALVACKSSENKSVEQIENIIRTAHAQHIAAIQCCCCRHTYTHKHVYTEPMYDIHKLTSSEKQNKNKK